MELLLTANVNVPTVGKGVVVGVPVANGKNSCTFFCYFTFFYLFSRINLSIYAKCSLFKRKNCGLLVFESFCQFPGVTYKSSSKDYPK